MYVNTKWYWNYTNKSTSLLDAHNLTSIAYQQLLLLVISVKLRPMVLWYTLPLRDRICVSANHTRSPPAIYPESFQSLFAAQLGVFEPISGQPNDTDLTWLHKELTSILIPFLYDVENGIHNLMGLVLDEDNYKLRYHNKFPKPTKPAIYDEAISNNATKVVRAKAEAVHTEIIADYLIFVSAVRKTRNFILLVVEDTRFHEFQ